MHKDSEQALKQALVLSCSVAGDYARFSQPLSEFSWKKQHRNTSAPPPLNLELGFKTRGTWATSLTWENTSNQSTHIVIS